MVLESEYFVFTEVEWQKLGSKEITQHASTTQKTVPLSLTSYCKNCENLWVASRQGKGSFNVVIGGVNVACPKCNTQEFVAGQFFGKT